MQTETSTAGQRYRTALVFVLGLIIGAGSMWLWGINQQSGDTVAQQGTTGAGQDHSTSTGTNSTDTGAASEAVSVTVPDQPAGPRVQIESVSVATSTWVAVHETLPDGSAGNALGAYIFDPGDETGMVRLLRSTAGEETYQVRLYQDDGDRDFELEEDALISGADGKAQATFTTFSGAAGN